MILLHLPGGRKTLNLFNLLQYATLVECIFSVSDSGENCRRERGVCEFQVAGGVLRLRMKLMVIIPWFLGVKEGEIEFENWGVGCV